MDHIKEFSLPSCSYSCLPTGSVVLHIVQNMYLCILLPNAEAQSNRPLVAIHIHTRVAAYINKRTFQKATKEHCKKQQKSIHCDDGGGGVAGAELRTRCILGASNSYWGWLTRSQGATIEELPKGDWITLTFPLTTVIQTPSAESGCTTVNRTLDCDVRLRLQDCW